MRRLNSRLNVLHVALAALLVVLAAGCAQLPGSPNEVSDESVEADETAEVPEVQSDPGLISALGQVVPGEKGTLSFTTSGTIVEMLVAEGDEVEAGDVIARLDSTQLDIAVEKAEAALAVAEAKLARTSAGPNEYRIDEAESNLQAATAGTVVTSGQRDVLTADPNEAEILAAQARVNQAYLELEQQRQHYNWVVGVRDNPDAYTPEQRATLPGAEESARQQVEASERNYELAQARLAEAQAGPNPAYVRAADAEAWASSAEYRAAQSERDRLLAGPSEQSIQLAEAMVAQAEAALQRAEAARDDAVLVVPFGGRVTDVLLKQAQYANAGSPVVMIADFSDMRVETTDLNELDVAQLDVGDEVTVTFDALPGVEVTGTVVSISPRAVEGAGVNFTATISLNSVPDGLRWGMTAVIEKQAN